MADIQYLQINERELDLAGFAGGGSAPPAHNGLVPGSSPGRPTKKSRTYRFRIFLFPQILRQSTISDYLVDNMQVFSKAGLES